MFQVRVQQGPKDGERILGRLGGSKRLVGLRLEPDPELAAEVQPPAFAQPNVLDRVEGVLPIGSGLAVEIGEILVVA